MIFNLEMKGKKLTSQVFTIFSIFNMLFCLSMANAEDPLASSIFKAVSNGDLKTIQLLYDAKTNFDIYDKDGFCLLWYASISSESNIIPIIDLIIKSGVNINVQNKDTGHYAGARQTALHGAADRNNIELVEFLLKHGVDPKIKDRGGKTALSIAVEQGYSDIVALLLPYK